MKKYSLTTHSTETCQILFTSVSNVFQYIPSGTRRILIMYQDSVSQVLPIFSAVSGVQCYRYLIPDSESAKQLGVAEQCWRFLAQNNFTRSDLIVSCGGGAASDLSGFVASSYLRGIKIIHIPTTLIGMVDAAIGGKTGINLKEGKNLVGSFYSPYIVLCDPSMLTTLNEEHLKSGLAEIIKCGFIQDESILSILEHNAQDHMDCSQRVCAETLPPKLLEELIHKAVSVKITMVDSDFRDTHKRQFLNYGHTLAHALEAATSHKLSHGQAVSIGMVYAAQVAFAKGLIGRNILTRHERILETYGLPVCPPEVQWRNITPYMQRDKKNMQNNDTDSDKDSREIPQISTQSKLVLLRDIANPFISSVSHTVLLEAYEAMFPQ
ncbi:3-dehydroquinate synthase [Tropheryma whipplei]|uniref:3-dehydroquinate synthase n=1 Tax=Tropheryma whipplei TaxID=2039 RepID=UPI002407BBFA|nr:3-dehydroquinate synthase [Tropheryma whipplei]